MRRIVTAITASALALSLVSAFGAAPASAAVAGYDAAFSGESAFVDLAPGQSNTFQVFFLNTGTTTWTKGTATQVDLAACLEDKVTCNQQDAAEAGFNPSTGGWLSATRYATTVQASVAPGSVGNFVYTVTVPANATAGVHHFNGALVLASTGADIHNVGYFQDVNVTTSATAATLTGISPTSGDVGGGTTVTLTGTDFACTPTFPTVTFDTTAATPTACGSTTLTVKSPAHAKGNVNVTVTNTGAAASNALLFTYADLTAPSYDSVSATSGTNFATLTFSEAVCANATFAGTDYTVTVNGIARTATSDNRITTNCGTTSATGSTTIAVAFDGAALVAGDTVVVTVTATGAPKIQDTSGNVMAGAQTRSTVVAADTTKPSISSAAAKTSTTIKLTYSEPVICGTGNSATTAFLAQFKALTGTTSLTPTAGTCPTSTTFGGTAITLTFGSSIAAGGSVSYTGDATTTTNQVRDLAGNKATTPQTVSYAAFTVDTTAPTITDAHVTINTGSSNFQDTGDSFTLTFSEEMDAIANGDKIQVQDNDPSTTKGVVDIICGTNATCTFNTGSTVLTVKVIDPLNQAGYGSEGTTAGLQLPLTILTTVGITDLSGNAPNLSASDKTID